MLANHDVIIIFPIRGKFPAIRKQILHAFFMIFIFSLIALKQKRDSYHTVALEKGTIFG